MERSRARRCGANGLVCGLISIIVFASTRGQAQSTPIDAPAAITLPADREEPGVVIFPARGSGPHSITVLLHGMCGDPTRSCRHFAEQVTRDSTLICPRATARCAGGGASWPESGVPELVERAVARARAALPPDMVDDTRGRTLIGYSMGAFRALEIAQSSAGKYPRVMLIGAKISLDQRQLTNSGVERLLLCAGSWDMMHDHMQREAQRIQRAGIHARFLDLGPVGHAFTPSLASYLPDALSWLHED